MTQTIYAIGDIHGQLGQLNRALALIEADGGPNAQIVFLGDYTDRGSDSHGVIDRLIRGQRDHGWICLKGNHDRMFQRFVQDGIIHDNRIRSGLSWLNPRLGGPATLASYGLAGEVELDHPYKQLEALVRYGQWTDVDTLAQEAREAVPSAHIDFLSNLPLKHETDDLFFVHAGIRPGLPLAWQEEDDLLWIRDGFLEDRRNHGPLIVHGHTALDAPEHFGNRVDLDGGAGYGNPLVPVVFEGRKCWTLTPTGRVPLER